MMDKKSEKVNFIFENEEFRFSAKLLKLINWSTTTRVHLSKTVQSSTQTQRESAEESDHLFESNINQNEQNLSQFLLSLENILSLDKDRNRLLEVCGQESTLLFSQTFPKKFFKDLVRFDCGSYAEVFRGFNRKTGQIYVFKVIRAISRDLEERVRGLEFHGIEKFREIFSEVRISSALSNLNYSISNGLGEFRAECFPIVFHKHLLEGEIPEYFLEEQISDTLTPIRKEPFEDFVDIPREYAVIVMQFGGQPLWKVIKNREVNASQLLSVLQQITIGLAIAEVVFEFEHRDLHISNILLKETEKEKEIKFIYKSLYYSIKSLGFEAMIIDTTFSRIKIGNQIYYKNMTNTLRFNSKDAKLTSQDKVYKWMVQLTKNNWKSFTPKTNVYWIRYLYKMILKSSLMRNSGDESSKVNLSQMIKSIEKCNSLQQFIRNNYKELGINTM